VRDLVHVFDGDGNGRGMHSGEFRWQSSIGLIMGRLAGITNAGTHRPPVFKECQRCHDAVMEGQFQGVVCRAPRIRRLSALRGLPNPYRSGQRGSARSGVRGTVEGVLITPCR
jgi:hypothetical protein